MFWVLRTNTVVIFSHQGLSLSYFKPASWQRKVAFLNSSLTDVLSTGVTVLCIQGLKAVAAIWTPFLHDVSLATQHSFTFKTAKVLHVPMPSFRFCAFVSKDNL